MTTVATTTDVLLLNADYRPIKVIPWFRAMCLILDDKASAVESYDGKILRSTTESWEWPAVIALREYVQAKTKVRFNRKNVLARDRYICQYCGAKPRTPTGKPYIDDLNLDHVIPRAQSRVNARGDRVVTLPWNGKTVPVTCWENIVCSCVSCNIKKEDRTPREAQMKLRGYPKRPTPWDAVWISLARRKIPAEWKDYLPKNSPWRDYWDVELAPS